MADRQSPTAGPSGWFSDTLMSASAAGLKFSSPQPPKSMTVEVNGLELRLLDWGNPRQPDLLFIHGFAQQAHSWDFAAMALQDLFHVVAMDLRGHGESCWSASRAYSFDDFLSDIGPFIAAAGLQEPVICGLSLGGRLAYTYVAEHPREVTALIAAESAPEPRQQGGESVRRFTSGPAEFDSLDELVERVKAFTPDRSHEQIRGSIVHSVRQDAGGNWTWKYDPAIRSLLEQPEQAEKRWQVLAKVNVPTLFVGAEHSDVTDAALLERMMDTVPGSRSVIIPRAGHRVAGDNPAAFNLTVRRFLSSLLRQMPSPAEKRS
jgi:pimeloyl-ACP methyl ester carboxylesterase